MLTKSQLAELLEEHGQPAYRATQILQWIYEKRAKSNALWFSKGEERLYWEQW